MRTLKMGMISLVVGETKGSEAAAILHGISAGVKGGGTTIHTDDPEEALRRLARLARSSRFTDLFAGATPQELRQAVARSVHVVVQLDQAPQSGRRYIRQVAEVEVADDGWRLHPVFCGTVQATADEPVSWERTAESIPRVQVLLSAYVEAAAEPPAVRLAAEQQSETERLLATAAILARSGDWDEAEMIVQQALALSPDKEEAHNLLERIQTGREETRQARMAESERIREAARQALAAGDLLELERLAAAAGLAHLDDLAAELSARLEEAREGSLPVAELFAQALERLGEEPERSARLLRAVLRREPDHPEAAFYLQLVEDTESPSGEPPTG
jgi:tetratricopeptide (TPR) repeat protein